MFPFAFDSKLMTRGNAMPMLYELVTRHPGSEQDLGPFLNCITWVLLITSGLAVLTTLATKRALKRHLNINDGFVVVALVYIPPWAVSGADMRAHVRR
jgi:hypothetical protein